MILNGGNVRIGRMYSQSNARFIVSLFSISVNRFIDIHRQQIDHRSKDIQIDQRYFRYPQPTDKSQIF